MALVSKELSLAKERVIQLEKKQQIIQNKTPKAYKARPEFSTVYYRSLYSNDTIYQLLANSENLTIVGGASDVGLKTDLASGETAIQAARFKPTQLLWIYGDSTPSRVKTGWGTTYTKMYDDYQGQSHRLLPFSKVSGTFGVAALKTAFLGMFEGSSASKKAIVGERGRAYLKLERQVISAKPAN